MANLRLLRIPQYVADGFPNDRTELIQQLFSNSFQGRKLSKEILHWQMDENPCLKRRATTLWDGNQLVAYVAFTPFYAYVNGNMQITAVSGTVMADIHYPGTSIQLLQEARQRNNDISLVVGFPNRNAFSINTKYLNHKYLGDLSFWIRKTEKKSVSKDIQPLSSFASKYEVISKRLANEYSYINSRTCDFLNWRFNKPGFGYRVYEYDNGIECGYIVVDTYKEGDSWQLQIIDILAESIEVFEKLIIFAIDLGATWNCSIVKLWLTAKPYTECLEKNGFEYGEHPFNFTIWDSELDFTNMYYTMMDSDVF